MPRNQNNRSNRGGGRSSERSAFGWTDTARENPLATAAAVGAAAAAGAFLWSRRNQISDQLSQLSDQFSEWTENRGFAGSDEFELESTGGGMGASMNTGTKSRTGSSRGVTGMSETGGGNATLGARSGGGGMTTSASGRGRARSRKTT